MLKSMAVTARVVRGVSPEVHIKPNRERQCADTMGTVPVPWAGHSQC